MMRPPLPAAPTAARSTIYYSEMPSLHSALDALTEASPSSSLLWSTTAADRFSAARTLVAALHAAPPTAITPLLPSLTDVLRPPLLDAAHAGCFAACADAAVAVATRCGDGALPLVDALVPCSSIRRAAPRPRLP